MKKLMLIAGISTVLLSFAMKWDDELEVYEQRRNAKNYIKEHNLKENCDETSYRLLEAIAKKDISAMNAIIENFPAQARPVLLNGRLKVYDVYHDFDKVVIAYPNLCKCCTQMRKDEGPVWMTPLTVAILAADEKILEALFEYGVHIDVNEGHRSPLKMATYYNPNAITFLLQKGAKRIDDALHDAAAKGDIPAAQALLKAGAKVNGRDSISHTVPLRVACEMGHCDMAKFLLEKGAFIDEIDSKGQTPLHWAVRHDKFSLVNLLLEHGANVLAKDKAGRTVIECIKSLSEGVIAMELLMCGAPYPTERFHQAMLGDFDKELRESSLFYQDYFRALIKGNTQGALAVIAQANGNHLNKATSTMKGLAPLHWAVLQNNLKVVQALIAKPIVKPHKLKTIAAYVPII